MTFHYQSLAEVDKLVEEWCLTSSTRPQQLVHLVRRVFRAFFITTKWWLVPVAVPWELNTVVDKQRDRLHLGNMNVLCTTCPVFGQRLWSHSTSYTGKEQHKAPVGLWDRSMTHEQHLNKGGQSPYLAGCLLTYCCSAWISRVMHATCRWGLIRIVEVQDRRFERCNNFDGASSDGNENLVLCLLAISSIKVNRRSPQFFLYGLCRMRLSAWLLTLLVLDTSGNLQKEVALCSKFCNMEHLLAL